MYFDRHTGKAAFVGSVHYAKGTYVGVVMDDAETGKNNGMLIMPIIVIWLVCVS